MEWSLETMNSCLFINNRFRKLILLSHTINWLSMRKFRPFLLFITFKSFSQSILDLKHLQFVVLVRINYIFVKSRFTYFIWQIILIFRILYCFFFINANIFFTANTYFLISFITNKVHFIYTVMFGKLRFCIYYLTCTKTSIFFEYSQIIT